MLSQKSSQHHAAHIIHMELLQSNSIPHVQLGKWNQHNTTNLTFCTCHRTYKSQTTLPGDQPLRKIDTSLPQSLSSSHDMGMHVTGTLQSLSQHGHASDWGLFQLGLSLPPLILCHLFRAKIQATAQNSMKPSGMKCNIDKKIKMQIFEQRLDSTPTSHGRYFVTHVTNIQYIGHSNSFEHKGLILICELLSIYALPLSCIIIYQVVYSLLFHLQIKA